MCLAQWATNGPWPAVGSHRGNANPDRTLTHATHRHTHTNTHTHTHTHVSPVPKETTCNRHHPCQGLPSRADPGLLDTWSDCLSKSQVLPRKLGSDTDRGHVEEIKGCAAAKYSSVLPRHGFLRDWAPGNVPGAVGNEQALTCSGIT